MNSFTNIDIMTLNQPIFNMLAKDWMLITAGTEESYNTMTASWGTFGFLWNMPVATIFIRPQRHTLGFTEQNPYFTLTFFGQEQRDALKFCGAKSGRDYDKAKETGITPIFTPSGNVSFQEATVILECEKLYADYLKPESFVDKGIDSTVYTKEDYHRFYVGRINTCFIKEGLEL